MIYPSSKQRDALAAQQWILYELLRRSERIDADSIPVNIVHDLLVPEEAATAKLEWNIAWLANRFVSSLEN